MIDAETALTLATADLIRQLNHSNDIVRGAQAFAVFCQRLQDAAGPEAGRVEERIRGLCRR